MTYRVHVRVMPRAGLLDPQGQAVEHALSALGFAETRKVHVGRAVEIEVDAKSRDEAEAAGAPDVRPAARQSGHRGLPGRGGGRLMVRVAVVRFPGSNCDEDARRGAGTERRRGLLRLASRHLAAGRRRRRPARRVQLRRLPPLRRHRPLQPDHAGGAGPRRGRRRRARHLQRLPDPLRGAPAARRADAERRPDLRVASRSTAMVERTDTVFTWAFDRKTPVRIPVAHGEGRYVADAETLARLEGEGQVVLRYLKSSPGTEGNPNGRATTSPASATRPVPSSASCPTPSGWSIRSSARPTVCSSCVRSPAFSTKLACRRISEMARSSIQMERS